MQELIPMNPRLKDKVILLAGAGGIGTELARRYAQEGAAVVLGDIKLDAADMAAAEANKDTSGEVRAIHLDGADQESVANAVKVCTDTYGRLDGLHANFANLADWNPEHGILDLSLEVYDAVQRVNARGFFLCTRAALPAILESGGGSIVYTSSAAAFDSGRAQLAYAMSKAAGHALMRHVARRYGSDGVRANTIAPALTFHEAIEELVPVEIRKLARDRAAIKSRIGRPADIAAMAALLMSAEGSYITGQVICVDGGTIMR